MHKALVLMTGTAKTGEAQQACHPSAVEMEVGKSEIQAHPLSYRV